MDGIRPLQLKPAAVCIGSHDVDDKMHRRRFGRIPGLLVPPETLVALELTDTRLRRRARIATTRREQCTQDRDADHAAHQAPMIL
jgi:hypothetical protein